MDTFLNIFLVLNAFVIGVGVTLAARYWQAHRHGHPDVRGGAPATIRLPAKTRQQLIDEAIASYRSSLRSTTETLVKDLTATATSLGKELEIAGRAIIEAELESFKQAIGDLHAATVTESGTAVKQTADYAREQQEAMRAEIEAEKTRLLAQIDTKLSDAVVSFLMQALGTDADLGAQAKYLTSVLDEHKADFKGRVDHGV